jgi:hypothetical protein
MATIRVQIVILKVRITLSGCPFNRMAHTANNKYKKPYFVALMRAWFCWNEKQLKLIFEYSVNNFDGGGYQVKDVLPSALLSRAS